MGLSAVRTRLEVLKPPLANQPHAADRDGGDGYRCHHRAARGRMFAQEAAGTTRRCGKPGSCGAGCTRALRRGAQRPTAISAAPTSRSLQAKMLSTDGSRSRSRPASAPVTAVSTESPKFSIPRTPTPKKLRSWGLGSRELQGWELGLAESGVLSWSHSDRAVEADHVAVQHLVLEDVPDERRVLLGSSQPGRKWYLLRE